MFGTQTNEMKIAELERQRLTQTTDISQAKNRLMHMLREDQTGDDRYAFGMVPGGRVSFSDCMSTGAQIEAAANHIERIDREIAELRAAILAEESQKPNVEATEEPTTGLKHDDTRWRWHRQNSVDGHNLQWVLESDEAKCMAIMELPHLSKWFKDRNPGWEKEWNQSVERVQANANLMQSSNIMLKALLAAQSGDTSLIQEAIEHATGVRNWLGDIVTGTEEQEQD